MGMETGWFSPWPDSEAFWGTTALCAQHVRDAAGLPLRAGRHFKSNEYQHAPPSLCSPSINDSPSTTHMGPVDD